MTSKYRTHLQYKYNVLQNAAEMMHGEKHTSTRLYKKIVSEYDQEMPQAQTADNPVAPRGRAAQPS